MTEFDEQAMLVSYLKANYPDVLFASDLSGVYMPKLVAFKMSRIRGVRGIPDVMIFEPRSGAHGLFIEMKATGTKTHKKDGTLRKDEHLEEQMYVLDQLRKKGYVAEICIGFEEARKLVDLYLE